ncbi:MAG TPA: hypothetical protein VF545_07340, partial [Thermoleophilaceae bacterium]
NSTVTDLRRTLHRPRRVVLGRNTWFAKRGSRATFVFKTRSGRVLEVGVADRRLTRGRGALRRFLRSWSGL